MGEDVPVRSAVAAELPLGHVIFKAEALRGGPPYQVAINQALRAYLHERETTVRKQAVEVVLTALDDETVRRKLRGIR